MIWGLTKNGTEEAFAKLMGVGVPVCRTISMYSEMCGSVLAALLLLHALSNSEVLSFRVYPHAQVDLNGLLAHLRSFPQSYTR